MANSQTSRWRANAALHILVATLPLVASLTACNMRTRAASPANIGAQASVVPYTRPYRSGINFGDIDGRTNLDLSALARRTGVTANRVSLPYAFLETFGYSIELDNGDLQQYVADGQSDLVAFLSQPPASASNAPAGGDTTHYSPKNLYEPIWLAPGVVNPANYWAAYVFRTVSIYKSYIAIWEVWNEPDFAADWTLSAVGGGWTQRAPLPAELGNWHDSVNAYVRLLRVSYEVIHAVDPGAHVAIGGISAIQYLNWVLYLTDDPTSGAVSAAYPATGGAYFDTVSFHLYPGYAQQDWATGNWDRATDSDASVRHMLMEQADLQRALTAYGYDGGTYPAKIFLCTETSIPSRGDATLAGGEPLAANFLVKIQAVAQSVGIVQIHWYQLFDIEPDATFTDPFWHMGLWYSLRNVPVGQEVLKPEGKAQQVFTQQLSGTRYDATATAGLAHPATVAAYVFSDTSGARRTVAWAMTANNREAASGSLTIAASHPVAITAIDGSVTTLNPVNGVVTLALSGSPVFAVEIVPKPAPAPAPRSPVVVPPTPSAVPAPPGRVGSGEAAHKRPAPLPLPR